MSISSRRTVMRLASALALMLAMSAPAVAQSPVPTQDVRIAVAYDLSGRGDGGFNDIAWNGAKRAADELGAELLEVTAKLDDTDAEREERLLLLAESGYDPIIGVGFTYSEPMARVAAAFPGTHFAIVDDAVISGPNIATITFKEHEGSFLVGIAAGLRSTTGHVGFIGAVPIPLIGRFEAGFAAGARAVDPDIVVDTAYLSQPPDYSGFGDPARGREAALGMFDAGADVVFAAAGGSVQGVIEAAAQSGTWAIGVDADMYLQVDDALKPHVLTSMIKNADMGTYAFVTSVADGTFQPGHRDYGLAEGGVGYATSGGFLDGVTNQIDGWATRIATGEVVVPEVPAAP